MFRIAVVCFVGFAIAEIRAQEETNDREIQAAKRLELAKQFVADISTGEFDMAVKLFDATMKRALTAGAMKKLWSSLINNNGSFQRVTEVRTEKAQQYEIVYLTCEFQQGMIDTKLVFNGTNDVAGLYFVAGYRSPNYVDSTRFVEQEIEFGSEAWRLPGTISLPNGDGPFPAIILVHGSGPNDRDETIGPNKPFRDLAHGLASRGIAVMRYEKRTKHYATKLVSSAEMMTVKEESIDDVVSAFELLKSQRGIDSRRIYVLGHSLGGMLLPRIANAETGIAGYVSLAGPTRPLEDLLLEQTIYILSLNGNLSLVSRKAIEDTRHQVKKVKAADLSAESPSFELPPGTAARYWLDLRGYDPAEAAKGIRAPMLILQGERDYQVTLEDFSRWKIALGTRTDVKFISYPALNHLFAKGKGKSKPAEYFEAGNVEAIVIDDLVNWINSIP